MKSNYRLERVTVTNTRGIHGTGLAVVDKRTDALLTPPMPKGGAQDRKRYLDLIDNGADRSEAYTIVYLSRP